MSTSNRVQRVTLCTAINRNDDAFITSKKGNPWSEAHFLPSSAETLRVTMSHFVAATTINASFAPYCERHGNIQQWCVSHSVFGAKNKR